MYQISDKGKKKARRDKIKRLKVALREKSLKVKYFKKENTQLSHPAINARISTLEARARNAERDLARANEWIMQVGVSPESYARQRDTYLLLKKTPACRVETNLLIEQLIRHEKKKVNNTPIADTPLAEQLIVEWKDKNDKTLQIEDPYYKMKEVKSDKKSQ